MGTSFIFGCISILICDCLQVIAKVRIVQAWAYCVKCACPEQLSKKYKSNKKLKIPCFNFSVYLNFSVHFCLILCLSWETWPVTRCWWGFNVWKTHFTFWNYWAYLIEKHPEIAKWMLIVWSGFCKRIIKLN